MPALGASLFALFNIFKQLENNSHNLINSILVGFFYSLVFKFAPWMFSFLFPMGLFASLSNIHWLKSILNMSLGFLIGTSFFIFSLLNNESSFNNLYQFMGVQNINDKFLFYLDYINNLLNYKKFIFLSILIFILNLSSKKFLEFKLLIISIFTGPLLFLIVGKTIQSYHIIFSFSSIIVVLFIFCVPARGPGK